MQDKPTIPEELERLYRALYGEEWDRITIREAVERVSRAKYRDEFIPELTRKEKWLASYKKHEPSSYRILNPEIMQPSQRSIEEARQKQGWRCAQGTWALKWLRSKGLLPEYHNGSPSTFIDRLAFDAAFLCEFGSEHTPPGEQSADSVGHVIVLPRNEPRSARAAAAHKAMCALWPEGVPSNLRTVNIHEKVTDWVRDQYKQNPSLIDDVDTVSVDTVKRLLKRR
jgi:hypothetical protein